MTREPRITDVASVQVSKRQGRGQVLPLAPPPQVSAQVWASGLSPSFPLGHWARPTSVPGRCPPVASLLRPREIAVRSGSLCCRGCAGGGGGRLRGAPKRRLPEAKTAVLPRLSHARNSVSCLHRRGRGCNFEFKLVHITLFARQCSSIIEARIGGCLSAASSVANGYSRAAGSHPNK